MKGNLHIARGAEHKMTLLGPQVDIHPDGTIWYSGLPLLGITDPAVKARAVVSVKARRWDEIPAEGFTRLGDNPNGLWAGYDPDWLRHPAKLAADAIASAKAEEAKFQISIFLSSRGWGDYGSVEWTGDSRLADAEILAACRAQLAGETDVDLNSSDAEILALVASARAKIGKPKITLTEPHNKNLCPYCGTYCYGDCGGKPGDETEEQRDRAQAAREQNIDG